MHHILYYIKKDMSSDLNLVVVLPIKLSKLLQHSRSEGVILLMHIQRAANLHIKCTHSLSCCNTIQWLKIPPQLLHNICHWMSAVFYRRSSLGSFWSGKWLWFAGRGGQFHQIERNYTKYKNQNKVSFSTGNEAYMYNAMTYCTRSLF